MRWRQAKKLIRLDGRGKGRGRRWSAWHRISARQWNRYLGPDPAPEPGSWSITIKCVDHASAKLRDLEVMLARMVQT